MTDNNSAISLPQSSALRPQGWEVEVEVITHDLTDEQYALVRQIKQLSAVVHMAGFERAKRLRLLRGTFPPWPPGEQRDDARKGWKEFLRREFDTNVSDVNREIAAIEAADEKLEGKGDGTSRHPIFQEIGSSHLNEIGRGATPAIRAEVWEKLLDGKLNINARAIRAEVKQLNEDSSKTTLKTLLPKEPDPTPRLPKLKPGETTGFGPATKLSRGKYGSLPEREKELGYLLGSVNANAKLDADLTKLLRSAGSTGKIARIKVLAAALHREFKAIGDRYQHSWDHNRDYPSYMTLWQHIWAEDDTFHLHAELEAVRRDISEANRYFSIANMRLFIESLEVVE